jgi:hypothetical protein
MKILYVAHTRQMARPYLDPASRYRCYNPAHDLQRLGHTADVVPFSRFNLDHVDLYDVLVFHKPPLQNIVEAAVSLARARGKLAIADYDDLIFDPRNALESSLYLTGRASKKIVLDIFKRNHEALQLFSEVCVSTGALAEQVQLSNPNAQVGVVHNGLNRAWAAAALLQFRQKTIPGRISYFCGTKSHDHDFALVEDVLAEFVHKHPGCHLQVVGPLEFNRDKFPARQLLTTPAVPYEQLPGLIMQGWINIAPLGDNVFNRCKSGLKFFEAAVFGVPTIASPIPDMQRFSDSNIVLARTDADWTGGLERLIDPEVRQQVALADRRYALEKCVSTPQTQTFLGLLAQWSAASRAPAHQAA